MVRLKIDGQEVEVSAGTTVLNAARQVGIDIPTLCDHPHLTPFGGCRLCVVEVEGGRIPQTSCTLPASEGMVVRTDTKEIRETRKTLLSLIFSERNHFCMFCQKTNGDCELQNCAYAEGMTHWSFSPSWEPFEVDASHPYFVIDQSRCILCRRCVRACTELVGNSTLAVANRGAKSILVSDIGIPHGESSCISCGTCVQVCPTGALIDRGSAYRGLMKDATHQQSVCLQCSVGCGVDLISRDNQLLIIDGDWDAATNEGLLCVKGRFEPLVQTSDRLLTPLVKKDGIQQTATWDEALDLLAEKLAGSQRAENSRVAAMASSRLSAEALSIFKQVFRTGLNCQIVTSTDGLKAAFASPQVVKAVGAASFQDLRNADVILTLGADLVENHSVAGFVLKTQAQRGAHLITFTETKLSQDAEIAFMEQPEITLSLLCTLAAVLAGCTPGELAARAGTQSNRIASASRLLRSAKRVALVIGDDLSGQAGMDLVAALLELAQVIKDKTGIPPAVLNLRGQANTRAAGLFGLDQPFTTSGQSLTFLALGDEPPSPRLAEKVSGAPFLVVQASHVSPLSLQADIVLPVEAWAEVEGHFMNCEGKLQAARAGVTRPAGVWTNAAVFADLADRLEIKMDRDWAEQLNVAG